MRHVEVALTNYIKANGPTDFISIKNIEDDPKVPPVVSFAVQSAPVGEVGVNGIQCSDMIEYTLFLLKSLNAVFPCRQNAISITKIEEALHWQADRTKDRVNRNVEGVNLA